MFINYMQIKKSAVLGALLYMPKSFGFFIVILRLVYDLEARFLHSDEIFPAEFAVMAHLLDFKSFFPHVHKPFHHIRVVDSRGVAHGKPAVVLPAKQRNIILLGF